MVEQLCVLGAGTMGHGIACAGLVAGCATRLYDPSPDALERARASIERVLQQAVSLGKLPANAAPAALARLSLHVSLEEAAGTRGLSSRPRQSSWDSSSICWRASM